MFSNLNRSNLKLYFKQNYNHKPLIKPYQIDLINKRK